MYRFHPIASELTQGDDLLAFELWREWVKRWPQLNERTKIQPVPGPEVRIYVIPQIISHYVMIRVVVSGWQLFKRVWTQRPPDDPEERWQYQKAVLLSPFTLVKFRLYRILGKLLKRPDLYNRGTALEPNPKGPEYQTDTIRLEQFGYIVWDGNRPVTKTIRLAYYPRTDTLYVRR